MANDDEQQPFVPKPPQSTWASWQPQPWGVYPQLRRNPLIYQNQATDLPPPPEPPPPPAEAREGDIEARFQDVLRLHADLSSSIDRLRSAVAAPATREIGPGHNQGPSLEDLDDVEDLIALFKDQGPRVKTAIDAKALIEQTEKVKRLPERIWSLLAAAGLMVATVGAREVTKDLTAPLWDDVARKISDLCHAIEVWVSLLPPM